MQLASCFTPGQIQSGRTTYQFQQQPKRTKTQIPLPSPVALSSAKSSSSSSGSNDQEDLLERARKLREQAKAMEDDLRNSSSSNTSTTRPTTSASSPLSSSSGTVQYTELENSVWTISYRFSSQPAPEDDDNKKDGQKQSKIISPMTFYSGKFPIRLKGDGYSELLPYSSTPYSTAVSTSLQDKNDNNIQITKIWGWDRETSNEDNQDYLLFSMDVLLPASDPDLPSQSERYYFQARVDQQENNNGKTNFLQLRDGTITVKKDVAEQTKGRWGLFNVAGILTQFRYCGDFVAKPTSSSSSPNPTTA